MYYEEKKIAGAWWYRTTPKGKWRPVPKKQDSDWTL